MPRRDPPAAADPFEPALGDPARERPRVARHRRVPVAGRMVTLLQTRAEPEREHHDLVGDRALALGLARVARAAGLERRRPVLERAVVADPYALPESVRRRAEHQV